MKEEVTVLLRGTRGEELKANPSSQRLASIPRTYWRAAPLTEFPINTPATTTMTTPTTVQPGSGKKPEVYHHTLPSNDPSKQPQIQIQEDEQETPEEEIDLTNYPPPDILKEIPTKCPAQEILLPILQSSLDNITDQVNAERLQRINDTITRRLEAEAQATAEAQQGKGKARAEGGNAIPIIRVNSEDTSSTSSQHEGPSRTGPRRSLFGIRRMVNKIIEKPESRHGSRSGSEASESRENLSGEMIPTNSEDAPGHSFHRFIKKHRRPSSEGDHPAGSEAMYAKQTYPPLCSPQLTHTQRMYRLPGRFPPQTNSQNTMPPLLQTLLRTAHLHRPRSRSPMAAEMLPEPNPLPHNRKIHNPTSPKALQGQRSRIQSPRREPHLLQRARLRRMDPQVRQGQQDGSLLQRSRHVRHV